VYTVDTASAEPIFLLTMVEDVKDRGGSGYVVNKARGILNSIFQ
jgi:hypothetical protein